MSTPDLPYDIRSAETPKDLSRWHSKREVLYNLYIHHRRTLSNVKEIMENNHGFPKTLKLSDYEHVPREVFRFRKNLSADEWRQSIGPRIAERKAAGKRSKVLLNGSEVQNVERRIRRSLQKKRSHRFTEAHGAVLPYGVIIRTPSPQTLALVPPPFGGDSCADDIKRQERGQSSMEFFADCKAQLDWLSPLMDVIPRSGAGSGANPLSAHLLREGCPINELLNMLNEYQCTFNHVDLRLFGPNATIGVLGKICFEFSNNLQQNTVSQSEMTSILDWIGYGADIASLKTFFSQKALTILAAWEVLNSVILHREHLAALDVILFVHSSLRDKAPLITRKAYHTLGYYLEVIPHRVAALINVYPCDQLELDQALRYAVFDERIEVVQQLIGAGASLLSDDFPFTVDDLVRKIGSRECQAVDLDLLKILLEAGAVVDQLPGPSLGLYWPERNWWMAGCGVPTWDWQGPGLPVYATDYLLLREHSTDTSGLWSLVSSYSDRQQTTVTVPGIFEAAQGGPEQLRSYLDARSQPYGDYDRKLVLELALSEASGRGFANVLQSLMEFGVDPNVCLLPEPEGSNFDGYQRSDREDSDNWHPVIRAANTGKSDTLRLLVTASSIDVELLELEVGALNLCALRNMESSQRNQILRLLSTLDLATAPRTEILLNALKPHHCSSGHDDTDFEFVNQLLELGLAFLDHKAHHDAKTPALLVKAIWKGCDVKALNYLVDQDMLVLSSPSIRALLDASINRDECRERQAVLELFNQRLEGFEAYVQENSSSLLSESLDAKCGVASDDHRDDDCEVMVLVKWLLGLGATLDSPGFPKLTRHATECFMLERIDSVPDIKVVDQSFALQVAVRRGHLNLAVVLIEKGGILINGCQGCWLRPILQDALALPRDALLWFIRFLVHKGADVNAQMAATNTALQTACARGAHLSYIRFLLDEGADVNALPGVPGGYTALQYAIASGSMNTVGLLLEYGADVNAPSGLYGSPRDEHYRRAIDIAVESGHLDMVHFLMAAGARSYHPGLTGVDGAITLATLCKHFAIAALLQKHAEFRCEDPMEAETKWLQANLYACVHNGRIEPKDGFHWKLLGRGRGYKGPQLESGVAYDSP